MRSVGFICGGLTLDLRMTRVHNYHTCSYKRHCRSTRQTAAGHGGSSWQVLAIYASRQPLTHSRIRSCPVVAEQILKIVAIGSCLVFSMLQYRGHEGTSLVCVGLGLLRVISLDVAPRDMASLYEFCRVLV